MPHPEEIQDVLDFIYDHERREAAPRLISWMKTVLEPLDGPLDEIAAPEEVAALVRDHLAALRRRLSSLELGFEAEGDPPIFWMDAELAAYLPAIGRESAAVADVLRDRAERAWEEALAAGNPTLGMGLWTGSAPPFIYYLVHAVLSDVLLPRQDAFERRRAPALSTAVLSAVHAGLWRKARTLVSDGHGHAVYADAQRVAVLRGLPEHLCSGEWLRITRSVTAHRLLRWLVACAFYQQVVRETRSGDACVVKVQRGFGGLARALHLAPSGKTRHELRDALDAMAAVAFDSPVMEGRGLCSWVRNKRTGELQITVAPPLAPDFVFGIGKAPGERAGRRLVPMTMQFPPLVGRERDHAAQLVLQQLVLRELRDRARELVERGGVSISDERWRELAQEADLPLAILGDVRAAWAHGGHDAPPFTATNVAGGLTLAPDYQAQIDMIREAGELERRGSENALKSYRAKRSRRAG